MDKMKTTKIIPFNWEYYQANKDKCRVITSHIEPNLVAQLTKFECADRYPLVGVVMGSREYWSINGNHANVEWHPERNLQLEVTEDVVESWVNVYEDSNGKRFTTTKVFDSETDALVHIHSANGRYIDTIPLHTIEKEGGEK